MVVAIQHSENNGKINSVDRSLVLEIWGLCQSLPCFMTREGAPSLSSSADLGGSSNLDGSAVAQS